MSNTTPNESKAKTKSAPRPRFPWLWLAVFVVCGVLLLRTFEPQSTVSFDNVTLKVAIADDEAEKELGLSNHKDLAPQEGMLFVYDQPGSYGIWMKEMDFSIDIIWLDARASVVHIETDVSPQTYPKVFYSDEPAQYILEANAGFAEDHGIQEGDTAKLPL